MRQRMTKNFHKRFGDRVKTTYQDRPLKPTDQKIQNARILTAFTLVLSAILKREPTQEELLGITKIDFPHTKPKKT